VGREVRFVAPDTSCVMFDLGREKETSTNTERCCVQFPIARENSPEEEMKVCRESQRLPLCAFQPSADIDMTSCSLFTFAVERY